MANPASVRTAAVRKYMRMALQKVDTYPFICMCTSNVARPDKGIQAQAFSVVLVPGLRTYMFRTDAERQQFATENKPHVAMLDTEQCKTHWRNSVSVKTPAL